MTIRLEVGGCFEARKYWAKYALSGLALFLFIFWQVRTMLGTLTLECFVTKSAFSKDVYTYLVLSSDATLFEVYSKDYFAVGSALKITGALTEHHNSQILHAEKTEPLSARRAAELFLTIERKISASIKTNECIPLITNAVTTALKPQIDGIARKLLSAQKMNRFILLRFHNDADGISGALALTNFIKCRSIQQNSASYGAAESIGDLNVLQYEWKPLIILLDFGSNEESLEGLKLVRAAGVDVVVIDHHPSTGKLQEFGVAALNPWFLGLENCEDLSKYTAGYLACEVSRVMMQNKQLETELKRFAAIACAGDKSKILDLTQQEKEIALVLSYIAAYSRYGNNLDFYRSVLKNGDLFKSVLMQANEKIAEMSAAAEHSMKEKTIGNLLVYVLDLENLGREDDFPSRGKVTTNIFESLPQEKPLLVLGYSARSVILRINDLAEQHGFAAQELVEKVKIPMKAFVESGGGHRKAAAIRVKSGFGKDVVEAILRILESS